ncbi:MAG: hypothetical protein DHS20C05_08990 [Hyphococcus sp.]|nr:MAG: hypothetical protein DHS20C05_08990 [Marinicaulis sp.]
MRKPKSYTLIIVLALLSFGCVSKTSVEATTTIEKILQDAEKFDGETVSVRGYFVFDFEDSNLYSSRIAYEDFDTDQCISLPYNYRLSSWQERDHRIGIVTGVVDATLCGGRDIDTEGDVVCIGFCNKVGLINAKIQLTQ